MDFDNSNREYNPYAPPAATAAPDLATFVGSDDAVLADRSTRFGAWLLDGLALFVACIPCVIAIFAIGAGTKNEPSPAGIVVAGLFGLLPFALVGYQWYLIATRGQTLGKRWTGIRIVRNDGSPVDFVTGVIMRNWIVGALGLIPYIGSLAGLVDALMIFGDERRCLHDRFANTKVIVATVP